MEMFMKIDWKRVARPQADGFDSYVIASFLKEKRREKFNQQQKIPYVVVK